MVESRFGPVTTWERLPARAHEVWRWDALARSVVSRTRATRTGADSHASAGDERRAQRAAADAGLAPQLLFDIDGGVLMELAPGRPLQPSDLLDDDVLARVTVALARLHAIDAPLIRQPDIRVVFAETLVHADATDGAATGGEATGGEATATVLDRLVKSAPPPCLVHGDPSPANLIDDGEHVRLVDFEYTRMAEPAYDLAALALGADLDCDETMLRRIVSAYPTQSPRAEAQQLLRRTADWVRVLGQLFAAWEAVQPPSPIG